jgi:F420-non-reducing hydrogenase small subunit
MSKNDKAKFAFYWASSCGGCEIAVVDIDAVILDVAALGDIVFWPCATDFKYKDVEGYDDGFIDITFFNGAIRNDHEEHVAKLLRQKSKVMIAFGACSGLGGIPGLGNFYTTEELFHQAFEHSPSTDNPDNVRPQPSYDVPEGTITIPTILDSVRALDQVVQVEYYIPGCPPQPQWIAAAVTAYAEGKLPPPGAVIAGESTVCDECPREKSDEKSITEIKRIHLVENDPDKCLLEQGIMCCGPATRSGCEAACVVAGQACRGCFGPTDEVVDMGAKLVSSIASIAVPETQGEIETLMEQVDDPAGYFYRFSLPTSMLFRAIHDATEGQ